MRLARSGTLARYALAGNLRTPYTWVGAILFIAVTLLGLYSSARTGDGWVIDTSLMFDGAVVAAVFGVRSGLIEQRTGGLQTFLRMNFMSPVEHMTGAILSLLGSWLLVCAGVFVLSTVLPGSESATAAWNTTVFAVRTAVVLPFVIMAESVTTIEVPFFLPGLAYVGLLMTLVLAVGEQRAVMILAPPMATNDYGTVVPALVRVAIVLPVGFGVVLIVTRIRGRLAGR